MDEYISGAEISARNKRAESYRVHVTRERTRRQIIRLQLVAVVSFVAWAVVVGVLVWAA